MPVTAIPTPISAGPTVATADPSRTRPTLGALAGPVSATIVGGLTLGLVPALVWPLRWAALTDADRPFYRDLAQWWRRRVVPADAAPLDAILNDLRRRPILIVLPWLAVVFAALAMASTAARYDFQLDRIVGATMGYHHGARHLLNYPLPRPVAEQLHTAWVSALSFAYACQWYAVRRHLSAVGDLVRWTNQLARENNFRRVRNDTRRIGLGPLWIVAGVALCSMDAWWAIPMVLAGAAQRRYAEVSTARLQQALSAQAGDAVTLSGPSGAARFCPTADCGNRLPAVARFCPRCGTPTVASA